MMFFHHGIGVQPFLIFFNSLVVALSFLNGLKIVFMITTKAEDYNILACEVAGEFDFFLITRFISRDNKRFHKTVINNFQMELEFLKQHSNKINSSYMNTSKLIKKKCFLLKS